MFPSVEYGECATLSHNPAVRLICRKYDEKNVELKVRNNMLRSSGKDSFTKGFRPKKEISCYLVGTFFR